MPAREPTIAASVVQSLCDALPDHQPVVQQGLRRFSLTRFSAQDSYHRVPLKSYLRLFEWLAEELESPNLGLELSDRTGVETIGAVGYLFLSSATLEQAFNSMIRNIQAVQDVSYMALTLGTRYALVSYRVAHNNLAECRQDNEYSLAFMWRLIQLYTGSSCPLVQVDFEHAPPQDIAVHKRLFKAPVLFNQPNNNIYLPLSAMKLTSAALDSNLFPILEAQLNESVAQQARAQRFSDQVIEVLSDDVLREGARAKVVAARLGISTATLHRRVRREGQSFKGLLDDHCKQLAQRMMSQPTLPIASIARRLGYAETACLTRAFRRWFGVTPRQYRKQQGQLTDPAASSRPAL
ncbi:MAG: AraC family transcriptional regulator [Pseudomonadota bacterium]